MPKTILARKQATPTGSIQPLAGNTIPDGFLVCDGSIVTIANYPKLYAAIGTSWGYGNNDGLTFHLPDLRGRFLRGVDNGAGRDGDAAGRTAANSGGNTGDNVGTVQGDAIRDITGQQVQANPNQTASGAFSAAPFTGALPNNWGPNAGNIHSFAASNVVPTASDNRPVNVNINYIIKL